MAQSGRKTKKQYQEVEVRALLSAPQWKRLSALFRKQTTKQLPAGKLTDAYFCPREVQSFKEIEMDRVGSYSLRLRSESVGAKTNSQLNLKKITTRGDHNSWEEREIEVSDVGEAEAILKAIGFKKFFSLEKDRYPFAIGKFNVFLEKIKDFGPVIEVEIMTTKEKGEAAKTDIRNFLASLGIKPNHVVPKSVTNILMREKSSF